MNKATLTADRPLKVKVGKISLDKANLVFSDGQKVTVNTKFLPSPVAEGDMIFLDLLTSEQYNKTKEEIACEVLKEILEPQNGERKKS